MQALFQLLDQATENFWTAQTIFMLCKSGKWFE